MSNNEKCPHCGARRDHYVGLRAYYVCGTSHVSMDDYARSDLCYEAQVSRLVAERDKLVVACNTVADWLSSFSMPPTSTIEEKQEMLGILEAVLAEVKGGPA